MKASRFTLALVSSVVLGLAAAGCSTSTSGQSQASTGSEPTGAASAAAVQSGATDVPQGDGSQTIYLVSKGFQHRFWQAVKQGAEQAGQEFNYKVEFVGPQDETKVTEQLNMLQTAIDSKPAAIGLAALDTGAASDLLEQIKAQNIPLIAFDSGVDSDIPLTTVATDNKAAAEEAATKMIELTGGKGKVGVVCHDQTSLTGKERCFGFIDYLKANAPDIEIVGPQIAGEVGLAANVTKSMIQANPDLVGFYGTNEAAASGMGQGVQESGKTDLKVVGFDSGKTQMDAIRSGLEAGAVTQSPVKMGYETVVAAIRAINGETLPKTIDSGFAWYDKTNIDSKEIADNLYQ